MIKWVSMICCALITIYEDNDYVENKKERFSIGVER
jgi:hypothetical protein